MRRFRGTDQLTAIGFRLQCLLAAGCGSGDSHASPSLAGPPSSLSRNPTYHGGPVLQHVRVDVLFWGPELAESSLHRTFNGFFQALFDDGRYMGRLAQFSAGGYRIGNGSFEVATSDGV